LRGSRARRVPRGAHRRGRRRREGDGDAASSHVSVTGNVDASARSSAAVELLAAMHRIRAFEEAAYRAYEAGEIAGPIHASIGQEAVAVGAISALGPGDLVLTHHRGHAHALAKGVAPARLFAELLGRAGGASGGYGGSMHVTDVSAGFLGSF